MVEVRYRNGRYCKTITNVSRYRAKQLRRQYEMSGMVVKIVAQ